MRADTLIRRLGSPAADLARLAGQVRSEPELVEAMLAAVSSEKARVKFAAAKALRILSGHAPELVYPHFEFFAGLLGKATASCGGTRYWSSATWHASMEDAELTGCWTSTWVRSPARN